MMETIRDDSPLLVSRILLLTTLQSFLALLDLFGLVRGAGYRLVHALLAGDGSIQFGTDNLDHLFCVRAVGKRSRILQNSLDCLVVRLAKALLPNFFVFHYAIAHWSTTHGDPFYVLLGAGEPLNKCPRGFLVRRVGRYGPVPSPEHRLAAGYFRQTEFAG